MQGTADVAIPHLGPVQSSMHTALSCDRAAWPRRSVQGVADVAIPSLGLVTVLHAHGTFLGCSLADEAHAKHGCHDSAVPGRC